VSAQPPLNAFLFTFKARPRAVLAPATLLFAGAAALMIGLYLALNWRTLNALPSLLAQLPEQTKTGSDPALAMAFLSGVFGLVGGAFVLLIPLFVLLAAFEAACLRWMIRGQAPGWFGMDFTSGDVWRVYGVYWCWLIGQYLVSFATSMATMPFMLAAMVPLLAAGKPDPANIWHWQLSVQLPLACLQYGVIAFLSVRFAPAAATAIARQRFSFLEAWTVTRGRSLAMFCALAGWWVIMIVGVVGAFAPLSWSLLAKLWPYLSSMASKPDPEAAPKYLADCLKLLTAPQTLGLAGLAYLAQAVIYLGYKLMTFGVNARAALAALEAGKIKVEPAG